MPEPRGKASSASRLLTNAQAVLRQRVFWFWEFWIGRWRRNRSWKCTLVRKLGRCTAMPFAVLTFAALAVLGFAVLTTAVLVVHRHELPHHLVDFC